MIVTMTVGKISAEEVEHIAWLAKIELSQAEKELFTRQFNTILEYFEVINEVDTETIQPTIQVVEGASGFREDAISPSLSVEKALTNAFQRERGFFKAPKII
jgi:aspartyl-tRNA(Asn)/glutamyl-tRNA(Gln) amidotransferase subunit C